MAGYISKFATGATIEAILDKANNSQSVSAAEKTAWNGKQDALTFDNTPTDGSNNPVKSGGVYTALNNNKANIDLIEELNGSRNYIDVNVSSQVLDTLTFTVNDDNSITVNGDKPSASKSLTINDPVKLPAGDYVLFDGSGASSSTLNITLFRNTSSWVGTTATGGKLEFTANGTDVYFCRIYVNTAVQNVKFKPMIISKEVYDAGYTSYISYAMTNIELTKLMENSKDYSSSFVRGINHRGYNYIAPENTIPAYVLSKKYGFDTVETDISFTSDGVPVLLHDDTVDRTSNGTGNISSMTYEEARALDFGSWKSEEYTGTKIPSFDEFVKLCRDIGLNIYAELKGTITQEQAELVAGIIKKYHMENNTTWISFSSVNLAKMVTLFPTARIGFVVSTVSASTITTASNLKNGTNEVFIDCPSITNALVEDCITAGIGVERWTINTRDAIINSNSYISGFTSDSLNAGKAFNQYYNV